MKAIILVSLLTLLLCCAKAQPSSWASKLDSYDWLYANAQQGLRLSPGIGNGYVGTTVFSDSVFVTGVYNGARTGLLDTCHRARIPSTLNIAVVSIDGKPIEFLDCALDMETGRYVERRDDTVERTIYIHREFKHLLVHELKSLNGTHEVCVRSKPGPPSKDINFKKEEVKGKDYVVYSGWTQIAEWEESPKIHIKVVTWEPKTLRPTKLGEFSSWSHCFTLDSAEDPLVFHTVVTNETNTEAVLAEYEQYVQTKPNDLMGSHVNNWLKLRKNAGKIRVDGYPELARTVNASLYELLISVREDEYWSSSPGGITTNSYHGHVFWDFETWMYPVFLVMHPLLAKNGLKYRFDHMAGARQKARDNDYEGTMWPWESAFTGDEVTRSIVPTGLLEHHISGDIIFAARQFDHLHRNAKVRREMLCPLAIETALYWASRVSEDSEGRFHITGVIPPDEYAVYVDDNIFTNDVAKISLLYANECRANATWVRIANNMHIEYDPELDYHPEYTGYEVGDTVKQADVILVSFPLGQNYSTSSLLNDLAFYEKATDPNGPAMTWAMFFINSLELASSAQDMAKATHQYFYKSFLMNVKKPYYVWWETPKGGVDHFATGAGGFLQSFLFGFAGLRICYDPNRPEVLARLKPVTPVELIARIKVDDIHLLEGKVKINITLERSATFISTSNEGLYLLSKVKGRFDLKPHTITEIPSNIGLQDKDGYYLMMEKHLIPV